MKESARGEPVEPYERSNPFLNPTRVFVIFKKNIRQPAPTRCQQAAFKNQSLSWQIRPNRLFEGPWHMYTRYNRRVDEAHKLH